MRTCIIHYAHYYNLSHTITVLYLLGLCALLIKTHLVYKLEFVYANLHVFYLVLVLRVLASSYVRIHLHTTTVVSRILNVSPSILSMV